VRLLSDDGSRGRSPRGLILLYHRVAELPADPQLLAVTPRRFAQHLELLRRHCCPTSLGQLVATLGEGRLPRRAVAVTFDDGYADNLHVAEPLLARYDVPATVFVTTAYVGSARELWWDDLERLLLFPGELPETLRVRIGPVVETWQLGPSAVLTPEDCASHADWNVECGHDPSARHRVYRDLCGRLRTVSSDDREAVFADLSRMAGMNAEGRATHRALSRDEVGRLAESDHIDIGAHTMTHPVLSGLPVAVQQSEVAGSKARLEAITKRRVTSFAYPFGGRADYTRSTVSLVRNAGFTTACANVAGLVRRRSDPWQLPRVLVRNLDADAFAGRLREWFGD